MHEINVEIWNGTFTYKFVNRAKEKVAVEFFGFSKDQYIIKRYFEFIFPLFIAFMDEFLKECKLETTLSLSNRVSF